MEMMIKLKNLNCNIRIKLPNFSNSPRAKEPFQNNEVENDMKVKDIVMISQYHEIPQL